MIPNLFKKIAIPNKIPKELDDKIKEFSQLNNKEEFLEKSFFYIVGNWCGNRLNLIFKFSRLYQNDLDKIIRTRGYLHCTTMNYLLRVMSVKSGFFNDNDIQNKLTNSWYIAPHQYLEITISDKEKIFLDPWNYQFGIDYGEYGSGFDSIKFKPVR